MTAQHPQPKAHPQRCIHSKVCRFRFVSDVNCDGMLSGDSTKGNRCTSFYASHTSSAQERIDAVIKELELQMIDAQANHNWERVRGYEKAIALLQAGRK